MGARRDVAVYAPAAAPYYRRASGAAGGAELQTMLLSRGLAGRGLSVAHIIYPLEAPPADLPPSLRLLERGPHRGGRRFVGPLLEALSILRAVRAASARAYLVRGGGAHLLPVALFCRLMRRKLVFSTSNDLDFVFDRPDRARWAQALYRRSIAAAAAIVVQSEQQLDLARGARPKSGLLARIPSFAEPAEAGSGEPDAFLWIGRLVDYKRPFAYVELARSLPEARFRMIATLTNETPAGMHQRLEAVARAAPNLELLEPRPREQVLELTGKAIAIVSTSRFEGMPNVFLEAWARGVPALTLDFDPDGIIAAGGLGLVADGSKEDLVQQAASLWHDRERRAELGERARAYVRGTHAPPVVIERWVELVDDVLGPRR